MVGKAWFTMAIGPNACRTDCMLYSDAIMGFFTALLIDNGHWVTYSWNHLSSQYPPHPQPSDASKVKITSGALLFNADINEIPFQDSRKISHHAKSDLAPTEWVAVQPTAMMHSMDSQDTRLIGDCHSDNVYTWPSGKLSLHLPYRVIRLYPTPMSILSDGHFIPIHSVILHPVQINCDCCLICHQVWHHLS